MGKVAAAAARANAVGTNFTGLSTRSDCDILAAHAEWQVHATNAIYGPLAQMRSTQFPAAPTTASESNGMTPRSTPSGCSDICGPLCRPS